MYKHALSSVFLIAVVAMLLTACAPRNAPPGPGDTEPEIMIGAEETHGTLITQDGLELPLRAWLPEGDKRPTAVILAVHGFNDYSHAFAEAGQSFAEQGIAVYAYDQRGFGEAPHRGLWPGKAVLAEDLRTAANLLRQKYPGIPLHVLGESMGGAVTVVAATTESGLPVDSLVLSAPAVWARSTQPWYQRVALWAAVRTVPWFKPSGEGLQRQASDNIEMLRELGRDPLVLKNSRVDAIYGLVNLMDAALAAGPELKTPTLVLYGKKDEIVPRKPVDRFWEALPNNEGHRYALYEDGWHLLLRDLQADVVISDIAAWVEEEDRDRLPFSAEVLVKERPAS
ncbi:alpha/beta hydrolase [Fodinicurvata fenggangensis]|uniref:alpha/beta hydrolase n=1 Tax=Fodinicurvata fenggangensis TaxID=1121830 RepID=UPI0012DCA05D|nr:alpha/beta hydrolase [Fodinicurvata fenggangensis]